MKQMAFGILFMVAFGGCYSWSNGSSVYIPPPVVQSSTISLPDGLSSHDFQQIMRLLEQRRSNSLPSLKEIISISSESNRTYRVVIDLYAENIIAGSEIYVVSQ